MALGSKSGRGDILIDDFKQRNTDDINKIIDFSREFPGNRYVIVTSDSSHREIASKAKMGAAISDLQCIRMLPLRRKNLRSLITKLTGTGPEADGDKMYDIIQKTIKSSCLPNNGLIYTVLCEIYLDKKNLNNDLLTEADVIENYIEILLKKHCEILPTSGAPSGKNQRAPYKIILNFLGYYSSKIIEERKSDISETIFEQIVVEYNRKHFREYTVDAYKRPLLESGILKITPSGLVIFSHKCFFDFAAAAYLDNNSQFCGMVLSRDYYLKADKIVEYYSAKKKSNRPLIDDLLKRLEDLYESLRTDLSRNDHEFLQKIREYAHGASVHRKISGRLFYQDPDKLTANRDANDNELDKLSPLKVNANPTGSTAGENQEILTRFDEFELCLSLVARVVRNSTDLGDPEYQTSIFTKLFRMFHNSMGISMYMLERELAPNMLNIIDQYLSEHGKSKDEKVQANRRARGFLTVFMAFVPRIIQRHISEDLGAPDQEMLVKHLMNLHKGDPELLSVMRMYYIDNKYTDYLKRLKEMYEENPSPNVEFSIFLKIVELLKFEYKLGIDDRGSLKHLASRIRKRPNSKAAIDYIHSTTEKKNTEATGKNAVGEPIQKWKVPGGLSNRSFRRR